MAGHSHAKNVMHRKEAQNKKKAKTFTKLSRAISVAIKEGGSTDINLNSKLKYALRQAQIASVPKDIIKRAIDKASEVENLEEILYEGYGPHGVAILVQVFSNNRNKTASEIRSIFSKYHGALGESNSVAFMFDHLAHLECVVEEKDYDQFFMDCAELDAVEIFENQVFFKVQDFHAAQEKLEKKWVITDAELCYMPKNLIELEDKETCLKLISTLEENENVQNCWYNLKE